MNYIRKLEYVYYMRERRMEESKKFKDTNTPKGSEKQSNIPTNTFPKDIDSFVSGLITADQLEEIKARKKRERRERLKLKEQNKKITRKE